MSDSPDTSHDSRWYQDRWEELMDLLGTSEPEDVIDRVRDLQLDRLDEHADALEDVGLTQAEEAKSVLQEIFDRIQKLRRENQAIQHIRNAVEVDTPGDMVDAVEHLQDRVETLEEQQAILTEAGFDRPEHAVEAIGSMEQQLDELYSEKEATEHSGAAADVEAEGDTFDQLQALLAREEKLQRKLGVSSPDAVIEMVEGLTDQLEDLYRERDAEVEEATIFSFSPSEPADSLFQDELGVSDPEAVVTMVNDLAKQLDVLYDGQEQLAELNLNGADDAIEMVQNMQHQLESLYERQAQLSEHGVEGVDHALSMIESMRAQLDHLYDARHRLTQQGVDNPDEVTDRLDELQEKIEALSQEKESLQDARDRLQTRLNELEEQVGTDDPEVISNLIGSMEKQLEDLYESHEERTQHQSLPEEDLLSEDTLDQLEELSDDELDSLPVGLFCVDDHGTVRRANENALQWPDVGDEATPEALRGKSFFDDLAPAAHNSLFRGRFSKGVGEGAMDERFLYTYVSAYEPPANLAIHLHRKPEASVNWIMFRVL